MKLSSLILRANLGLLLLCCHSWGDEPGSITGTLAPGPALDQTAGSDDSAHRAQAAPAPNQRPGQPGPTSTPPRSTPLQEAPSRTAPAPQPPSPAPPATPSPIAPTTTPAQPTAAGTNLGQPTLAGAAATAAAELEQAGDLGELSSFGRGGTFQMIGDRGPLFARESFRFPPVPTPLPPGVPHPGRNPALLAGRSVAAIVPAVRGEKIADNQSPRPTDRVFVSFNYFDGVNSGLNRELGAPIKNMQVYNEISGIEKTFWDQQASIGFRIPVNTLTLTSGFPGLSGSHTSTGNFSSFFKYVLWEDNQGSLLSAGLDMSFPTGPKSFAGYPTRLGINSFELQPFFGYIYQREHYFLQGFNSIAVPTDRNLATMYYFDIGVGYFLYQSKDPQALVSAIVPVFETHLNIPLNWAGFQPRYIGSTPDVVDFTWGLKLALESRAIFTAAYIHSVTGPAPFSGELAVLLNVYFGGRPGRIIPFTPTVIGQ